MANRMRNSVFLAILAPTALLIGCASNDGRVADHGERSAKGIVFFNITSNAKADPHSVTMALQLAKHAMDDGRSVVLFFNVRAVEVPTVGFPADVAFKDKPIKGLLANLIKRGADVHVCPHCMKALDVKEPQLIPGAKVTTREALFSKLGPTTVVFTY